MGGGFALHLGYSHIQDIAGVFAMSSYLPQNSSVYRVNFSYDMIEL